MTPRGGGAVYSVRDRNGRLGKGQLKRRFLLNLRRMNLGGVIVCVAALSSGCLTQSSGSLPTSVAAIEVFSGEPGSAERLNGNILELGTIPQGGVVTHSICFRNHSADLKRITSFESSCECMTIEGLPVELPSGETAPATVRIDPGATFVGELEVVTEISGPALTPLTLKIRCSVEQGPSPPRSETEK